MEDVIKQIIIENIPDAVCLFEGDSCNLKLIVISNTFKDIPLINQHRIIMKLLESRFQSGDLHALSLETRVS